MQTATRYKAGDTLGRFMIFQALTGGMGEVYLSVDTETLRPYALKTLKSQFLDSPGLHEAFRTEVETWISLGKHPHIVRCFYMDDINDQPFMFLEWVAADEDGGTDLRSRLRRGALAPRHALDYTIDVCRGLVHAGLKKPGIVHRDLKPDNILVGQGEVARITDFGLAKIAQAARLDLPDAEFEPGQRANLSSVGGTPPYMAPEQWVGSELDARTDIYAVGCILYELLTGRWPFVAATLAGFGEQHANAAAPSLPPGSPLASALNPVLARCMAKQPRQRFPRVEDLLGELSSIYEKEFGAPPRDLPVSEEFTARDHQNRGTTYLRLGRRDEALADLNRAVELEPQYPFAYVNRARVYADMKQYDKALADMARALEIVTAGTRSDDPEISYDLPLAQIHYLRGNIFEEMKDWDRALADFTRAVVLDPTFAAAYRSRAELHVQFGRFDDAFADYDKSIELDPTSSSALNMRGTIHARAGRYREAIEDLNRSIRLKPDNATAYSNRGLAYQNMQRYPESLADFDRALALEPDAETFYNRAITYQMTGHHDQALHDYTSAFELNPAHAQALTNRGTIYQMLGQHDEAVADLTRALTLNPRDVKSYFNRGNSYVQLGRYNDAEKDFMRAIELDSSYPRAYFGMGGLYAIRGDMQQALRYFEAAARLGYAPAQQYATMLRGLV